MVPPISVLASFENCGLRVRVGVRVRVRVRVTVTVTVTVTVRVTVRPSSSTLQRQLGSLAATGRAGG